MNSVPKGAIVKTPQIKSGYLSSDKEYEVIATLGGSGFIIRDDNKKKTYCKLMGDGHLNGLDWELKQSK